MAAAAGLAFADEASLWLSEGVDLNGRRFAVDPVTTIDPRAEEEHAVDKLRTELAKGLAQLEMLDTGDKAPPRSVRISCEIKRYSAGNVAGRWIGGKFGAAYIVVLVKLAEQESHQLIGEMVAVREIAGGGLFSIEAGSTIVTDAADEIVKAISNRVAH